MKAWILLVLGLCNTACAELPPVVGNNASVNPNPVVNAPKAPTSTASYEMIRRLEQMQAEVQQLTGKVEEQAFQIEELKKQQKTMYTDFDDRLQAIENKSGSDQSAAAAPPSADSSSATESTPATSEVSKSSVEEPLKSEAKAEEPPVVDSNANNTTSSSLPVNVSEAEKQDYQRAYDDLRNGKTAQAITGFNAYLTNHPGSGYASNAQYWLGEAHRVNLDNAAARTAFNAVVDSYPDSAKVPDALYKLGIIELEENNQAKAREIFTRITNEFGSSKAAVLAQKKLQTLN